MIRQDPATALSDSCWKSNPSTPEDGSTAVTGSATAITLARISESREFTSTEKNQLA